MRRPRAGAYPSGIASPIVLPLETEIMSMLTRLLRWLGLRPSGARRPAPHPDTMSLRDWADLPPHHPLCDSGAR